MRALTVMDPAECRRLLATRQIGRIALVHDGRPLVVPVQYRYDGASLVYRTRVGGLLDPGPDSMRVAVEIDGSDALYHLGWNVVLEGVARRCDDPAASAPPRPWFDCNELCTVHVDPATITGRRILGL